MSLFSGSCRAPRREDSPSAELATSPDSVAQDNHTPVTSSSDDCVTLNNCNGCANEQTKTKNLKRMFNDVCEEKRLLKRLCGELDESKKALKDDCDALTDEIRTANQNAADATNCSNCRGSEREIRYLNHIAKKAVQRADRHDNNLKEAKEDFKAQMDRATAHENKLREEVDALNEHINYCIREQRKDEQQMNRYIEMLQATKNNQITALKTELSRVRHEAGWAATRYQEQHEEHRNCIKLLIECLGERTPQNSGDAGTDKADLGAAAQRKLQHLIGNIHGSEQKRASPQMRDDELDAEQVAVQAAIDAIDRVE